MVTYIRLNNMLFKPIKEVMTMKWNVLFVILAVLLLAGCAQKAVQEETTPVVEDVVQEEIVQEEEVEEVEEEVEEVPQPTTETITILDNSAEPADLSVVAGSTIVFKCESSRPTTIMQVRGVEFNEKSPRLKQGDMWEITLDNPGEYDFLDIIIARAKGTITVE